MNFFEQQHIVKTRTKFLVLYLIIAVFLIIVVIDAIVLGIVLASNNYNLFELLSPSKPGTITLSKGITFDQLMDLIVQIALYVSPIVIAVIAIGSFIRMFQLRRGGVSVAEMAEATPIDPDPHDLYEKKFRHVVEEMSIASGIPIPKLYVLQHQNSINAFVAGLHPNDTVMVITKGALMQLNRDELQGVVAHEFGHILNSDMQFSFKLIGILAGILLIGQIGTFVLRTIRFESSKGSKKGNTVLWTLLLGIGLYLAGYIGLFFGRLIKAAISRQRELLADACSVQFTRNPTGLVGALYKISQSSTGTYLKIFHAEDISHICFCPSMSVLFTNLLNTHPPIEVRINQIDPNGLYRPEPDNQNISTSNVMPILNSIGLQVGVAAIQNSIGNPDQAHIDLAVSLLKSIPEPLVNASHDAQTVIILYYSLLLSRSFTFYEEKNTEINQIISAEDLEKAKELSSYIKTLDPRAILPLLDLSIPAFKFNLPSNRQLYYNKLEKLSNLSPPDLYSLSVLAIIGKNVERLTPQDLKPQYSDFQSVLPEMTTLLSFVVCAYHEDNEAQNTRFQNAVKQITHDNLQRLDLSTLDIQTLLPSLKKLNLLTPLCKEKLLHICLNLVQDDQKITLNEAEIIRVIACALDCPIPPIISTV